MKQRLFFPGALALALLAPGSALAQQAGSYTVDVRVLGSHIRPALSDLDDAFGRFRAAETSGEVLGSDPAHRRAVAASVRGDEDFSSGWGAAAEVGLSRKLGAPAAGWPERFAGLALQAGYEQTGAGYRTSFQGGMDGSRRETLHRVRAVLQPRLSIASPLVTATAGVSAGLNWLRYENDSGATLVSESGRLSSPKGAFSGEEVLWSAGVFGELERRLSTRLGLFGRVGYEYVPATDLQVTGSDIDAVFRDRTTNPPPPRLGFPDAAGVMDASPVSIELRGWRVEAGVAYRFWR